MQLADLDSLAIKPTSWPRHVRGYTEFTEHVAISADVGKALTGEADFDQAAQKSWFSAGYLLAISNPKSAVVPDSTRPPETDELPVLHRLLAWLAPIHAGARDNSGVTDTATLAHTFQAHAKATLSGLQFQPIVPVINRDGVMLQPDPASLRQTLTKDMVAERSKSARDLVFGPAFWLGRHHTRASRLRIPRISRSHRQQ